MAGDSRAMHSATPSGSRPKRRVDDHAGPCTAAQQAPSVTSAALSPAANPVTPNAIGNIGPATGAVPNAAVAGQWIANASITSDGQQRRAARISPLPCARLAERWAGDAVRATSSRSRTINRRSTSARTPADSSATERPDARVDAFTTPLPAAEAFDHAAAANAASTEPIVASRPVSHS